MQVRRAVRRALADVVGGGAADPLVLVGVSGGADSLALAAALAAEAAAAGALAGALVVDHGLQPHSADVAQRAAGQAESFGLDPVVVRRVSVRADGGPEAAARAARYDAFTSVASAHGAAAVLTAHTRDDQAEQVLLGLARGSGTRSIAGIPVARALTESTRLLRPLLDPALDITRATTAAACVELGLEPWQDPHNQDPGYARVRVRETVLPLLVEQLGEGVRAGLARSADLAREDALALDEWADRVLRELGSAEQPGGVVVLGPESIGALTAVPAAIRQRVIHRIAAERFGANLSRQHTLALARLVTDWRGRGPAFVPGIRATRTREALTLAPQFTSPRG